MLYFFSVCEKTVTAALHFSLYFPLLDMFSESHAQVVHIICYFCSIAPFFFLAKHSSVNTK